MADKWDQYAQPTDGDKWERYAQPSTVPGTEKTGLPSVPKAALPTELQSDEQQGNSFLTSPNGLIRGGLRGIGHGIEAVAQPGKENKYRGGSEIIKGIGSAMLPAAIPAAVAAPVAAGGAALGGMAGGWAGRGLARLMHASPEGEEFAGNVGSLPGGMIGGKVFGALPDAIARPVMRSALNLPSNESAQAVLEHTGGVRPETIAKSAGSAINNAASERDNLIRNASEMPSLAPARESLIQSAGKRISGNRVPTEMHPMVERLSGTPADDPITGLKFQGRTEYAPGAFTPINITQTASNLLGPNGKPLPAYSVAKGVQPDPVIAERQNPEDFLGIRNNFGKDFTKFDFAKPLTKPALQAGNKAYMELTNELHRVAPGSAARDELIHNLLPAKQNSEIIAERPGPLDRFLLRAARPTGGLAATLAGYAAGGPKAAGLVAAGQEMLADPTARAAMARGLHGVGGDLPSQLGVPFTPIRFPFRLPASVAGATIGSQAQ